MTKEEKEDPVNQVDYDMTMGLFLKITTIIFSVICSCIVLGILIFSILVCVKGKDWVMADKNKKDAVIEDNSTLL